MREFIKLLMGLTGYVKCDDGVPLGNVACIAQMLYDPNRKLPMLTPVVVDSKTLMLYSNQKNVGGKWSEVGLAGSKSITTRLLFPQRKGLYAGSNVTAIVNKLRVMDPKTLFDGHKVKQIDTFEMSKLSEIDAFTKEHGVITFILKDLKAAIEFVSNTYQIKDAYKHNVLLGHYNAGNTVPIASKPNDKLMVFISFFNLPFAIPIYNKKKIDGMGIRVGMFWPNSSKHIGRFHQSDEVYAAVSNYKDNLLIVDGQNVNNPGWIGNTLTKHLCGRLASLAKQNEYLVKTVSRTKKEIEVDGSKANNIKGSLKLNTSLNASTWATGSTTSTCYYTNT